MMRTPPGGQNHAIDARRLLRAHRHGSLATLSQRLGGYPFATVVPYMVDHDASAVILVSRLAEHTKNIEADARTSLMVHALGADVQAAARLTVAGMCQRRDASDRTEGRYLRLFPAASELLQLDFDFYRIEPVAIRYIAGFGSIHWLPPESFATDCAALASAEEEWLRLINGGNLIDLRACCRHFHSMDPVEASAVALDCDGMDLRADGALIRIPFAEEVVDADGLHRALEELHR